MKKKIISFILMITIVFTCFACSKKTVSNNENSSSKEVKTQEIEVKDLEIFANKGLITGVKDITVEQGTNVILSEFTYADQTLVKSIDIDDSKVDYNKADTYDAVYTITFNGDKLRDYIKDNNLTLNFDTDGDTVIVKTTITITVATKEEAEDTISKGNSSIITEDNKEIIKNNNKTKTNDIIVESKVSESGKSSNNDADSSKKNDAIVSSNDITHNSSSEKTHNHNYIEVSHINPSCTEAGIIIKKCSCGDTITEQNSKALGHNPVTEIVTEAWTENVYDERYVCNGCGAQFMTDDEAAIHITAGDYFNGPDDYYFDDCNNYSLESVVVDTINHPAIIRTYCSRCNQTL